MAGVGPQQATLYRLVQRYATGFIAQWNAAGAWAIVAA